MLFAENLVLFYKPVETMIKKLKICLKRDRGLQICRTKIEHFIPVDHAAKIKIKKHDGEKSVKILQPSSC